MPSFRGIEISVFTQSVIGRLPEYPHPEGPSFQHALNDISIESHVPLDHDQASLKKENTMVSIYIPSVPGSQFWINYVVERDPSPPSHIFFKLYMNGRHITSWGINPKVKREGRVEKALYEPSERWSQEENGVVFNQEGIETRYFHFVGCQQEQSIAEDGGIIEVQVFRAKGRKRRAARLDQYRHQDKYGITAPSGGLLDNPQDITFFDFHLIDPKDAPFATFRFHYRSWANLCQLNLVPSSEPEVVESPNTFNPKNDPESISDISDTTLEHGSGSNVQFSSIHLDRDESVFSDSVSNSDMNDRAQDIHKPQRNSSYILRTPPQLRPRSTTSHNLPQPSKTLRDCVPPGCPESILQRPLPDRPLPELPAVELSEDSWIVRSRKSSSASAAPSVATSLLSYVNNDSYLNETVEYGQAQEVRMDKDHPGVPLIQEQVTLAPVNISVSDHDDASLEETESKNNNPILPSPINHLSTTGRISESTINQHEGSRESSSERAGNSGGNNDSQKENMAKRNRELAIDFSVSSHLQLAESEWLRRTPSPQEAPRRILSPRLGRLWNTLRRNKSRSPLRNLHNELSSKNFSTSQLTGPEVKERHGNWI